MRLRFKGSVRGFRLHRVSNHNKPPALFVEISQHATMICSRICKGATMSSSGPALVRWPLAAGHLKNDRTQI